MLRVLRLQCRGRRHGHLVAEGRSKSHALSLLLLILLRCYLARQVDELKMDRLMDRAPGYSSTTVLTTITCVTTSDTRTCCNMLLERRSKHASQYS